MYGEAGHIFLARLGKTTLRPGGIDATSIATKSQIISKHVLIRDALSKFSLLLISIIMPAFFEDKLMK